LTSKEEKIRITENNTTDRISQTAEINNGNEL
jgi:hypothetical protein